MDTYIKKVVFLAHQYLAVAIAITVCLIPLNSWGAERLISDGGFENGPSPGSAWTSHVWTESEDPITDLDSIIKYDEIEEMTVPAYQCEYVFWGGGYYFEGGDEESKVPLSNYVEQEIDVPEGVLGLSFATYFYREPIEDDETIADDKLIIKATNIKGEVCFTSSSSSDPELEMTQENNSDSNWKQHIENFSDCKGPTVTLHISAVSSGELTGNVFVDAVDLYGGLQQLISDNKTLYPNQDYTDDNMTGMDIFIADDFVLSEESEIFGMVIPGGFELDNLNSSLDDAEMLHFEIYKDLFGKPDGHPKDSDSINTPVWSMSLLPADPQLNISAADEAGGDVELILDSPFNLQEGRYWLVFYPEMPKSDFGQYGRNLSDTVSENVAMVINPGGANSVPDQWTPITSPDAWSTAQQDFAFTIYFRTAGEPDIDIPTASLAETVSEDATSTVVFTIANIGDALLEVDSVESDAGWISLYPESGTVEKECGEMEVTLIFDATGMDTETYSSEIEITSTDPDTKTITIPVKMTVTERADTLSNGTIQFSSSTYTVMEYIGSKKIRITRTGGSDGIVGVDYKTMDGTAKSASDYEQASGQLSWSDGDSSAKEITITIKNDNKMESNESLRLFLSNPTGGAAMSSPNTAVLTIINDDKSGDSTFNVNDEFTLDSSGCFVNSLISTP